MKKAAANAIVEDHNNKRNDERIVEREKEWVMAVSYLTISMLIHSGAVSVFIFYF